MYRKKIIASFSLLLLIGCAHRELQSKSHYNVAAVWTELGPQSSLIVRAVTNDRDCPSLVTDVATTPMKMRGANSPEFPEMICEAVMPEHSKTAQVGQTVVPIIKQDISKIVIIGDTGCRIKKHKDGVETQACNDANAWPFAIIAKTASQWHPDLVIHVGDYHYRESECPAGNEGCKGAHFGDNWVSWNEDFFQPAAPLLAEAPWIFVRGNHEICQRAGRGWFHLLDAGEEVAACSDGTIPFWVQLAEHQLVILDSADDENLRRSLRSLRPQKTGYVWLLSHRPFLSPGADDEAKKSTQLPRLLLGRVSAVIVGHKHQMSFNQFKSGLPPEIIAGNGGDNLHPEPLKGKGMTTSSFSGFGFLTLEKVKKDHWTMISHDHSGKPMIRCELHEARQAQLQCQNL